MRRSFISVVAVVLLLGLGVRTDLHAAPAFVSSSLSAPSGGAHRCSVFNAHPTKTALIVFFFSNESCLKVSGTVSVPPGFHGSFALAASAFSPGPVNCRVQFLPANEVTRGHLLPSFSVEDSTGQTTAALPITMYKSNLVQCP